MRFSSFVKTGVFGALILGASLVAYAAPKAYSRGVGAGILFPAPGQALIANPAGMDETGRLTLTGLYRLQLNDPYASLVARLGALSVGGAYLESGNSPEYRTGMGLHLGGLRLGVSYKQQEGALWNADAGASIQAKTLRFGAVLRDFHGNPTRVDLGVGFRVSTAMIEFNYKKPLGNSALPVLLDLGVSTVASFATLGFGYSVQYDSSSSNQAFSNGHFHAGVSVGVGKRLFLETFYRPLEQEWTAGEWAAGLRVML